VISYSNATCRHSRRYHFDVSFLFFVKALKAAHSANQNAFEVMSVSERHEAENEVLRLNDELLNAVAKVFSNPIILRSIYVHNMFRFLLQAAESKTTLSNFLILEGSKISEKFSTVSMELETSQNTLIACEEAAETQDRTQNVKINEKDVEIHGLESDIEKMKQNSASSKKEYYDKLLQLQQTSASKGNSTANALQKKKLSNLQKETAALKRSLASYEGKLTTSSTAKKPPTAPHTNDWGAGGTSPFGDSRNKPRLEPRIKKGQSSPKNATEKPSNSSIFDFNDF